MIMTRRKDAKKPTEERAWREMTPEEQIEKLRASTKEILDNHPEEAAEVMRYLTDRYSYTPLVLSITQGIAFGLDGLDDEIRAKALEQLRGSLINDS